MRASLVLALTLLICPPVLAQDGSLWPARNELQVPPQSTQTFLRNDGSAPLHVLLALEDLCAGHDSSARIGSRNYPVSALGETDLDVILEPGEEASLRCGASCDLGCVARYQELAAEVPAEVTDQYRAASKELRAQGKALDGYAHEVGKLHDDVARLADLFDQAGSALADAGDADAQGVLDVADQLAAQLPRLAAVETHVDALGDATKSVWKAVRPGNQRAPIFPVVRGVEAVHELALLASGSRGIPPTPGEPKPPGTCSFDLVCGCCPDAYFLCLAEGNSEAFCSSSQCESIGCDGTCGAEVWVDDCGLLCGDSTSCQDPDGDPGVCLYPDLCGVCGGDGSTCAGCDGVPNSGVEWGVNCETGEPDCGGTDPDDCPLPLAVTVNAAVAGSSTATIASVTLAAAAAVILAGILRRAHFQDQIAASYDEVIEQQLETLEANPLFQDASIEMVNPLHDVELDALLLGDPGPGDPTQDDTADDL